MAKINKATALIWGGVAFIFGGTIASIPLTVKATHAVDKKKKELKKDKLPFKEFVKTVWPYYIPTVVCTAIGFPLIWSGNKEYGKKIASYAAIASSATSNLQKLEEKIPEIVGEKDAKKIKESIAQDKIDKIPESKTVVLTNGGSCLFYEPISNQLFRSSIEEINKITNTITATVNDDIDGEVSFNEFLYRVGVNGTPVGDCLVWSNRKSFNKGKAEFEFTTTIKGNQPCIVLEAQNLALKDEDGRLNYDWR